MSRRRRQQQPDSLELLLDTMCNTFGGIIMIALLIALLSRDASSESRPQETRQMQSIEQQISEAEQLQRRLKTNDPAAAATLELLTQRDELRQTIDVTQQTIQSNNTTLASMPVIDPTVMEQLVREFQSRTNELQKLEEQIDRDMEARQRVLRLPRERASGKRTYYFIVRYGQIFPVHVMREGARALNTQSLEWRETAGGESAIPRRGQGLDAASFARMLTAIPAQTYSVHFLAYNDSFPTFIGIRQVPLARNYDTGWEFLPEDKPVIFSSRGEAPPAL